MRRTLLLISLALVGCSVAPKAIKDNYSNYNEAIHYNESQQMLLNLVRLKYRETPLFLKVGAISTSYDVSVDAGANIGRAGSVNAYGLNAGARYASRPTVTYTPIEGNTFVKQVLAEVDRDTFVLLFRSGWPIDRLCHIMVERITEFVNNRGHQSYPEFEKLIEALVEAQENDDLEFAKSDDDELYMRLLTDRKDLESDERLSEKRMVLVPFSDFQLRSFLDIMFFLGKNTQVPPQHADHVKSSTPNGWIDIRWTSNKPNDAVVWVQHHGQFFSLAAADIRSKDTFALLKLLFQVQAGDIQTVQPLLTLPVAQP